MQISELHKIFLQHPVISTDSRNCPNGCLFFALKGERFDGNDYIMQVLENGAAYAVGDNVNLPQDERIILVPNVLKTLQELANFHRKQMNVTVIGITGTNGKTTTKELTANILATQFETLYTLGNFNNHIGVPLTLLRIQPQHEYAVIEMGANHPGEIAELCAIADPDFGLITNVGMGHLEGFGSFEGVINTKTELYNHLRNKGGMAFGNADNLILKDFYKPMSMVFYGTTEEDFVHGKITQSTPTLGLEWQQGEEKNEVITQLVGAYNFENVMAAICIGSYFSVKSEFIKKAIEGYCPTNNRSQIQQTNRNELIIDAYNANPSSMKAALENFMLVNVSASTTIPSMVILGEMGELGKYAQEEHQKIVNLLLSSSIEEVFLVGKHFAHCANIPMKWRVFQNTEELIKSLEDMQASGYRILIKGSRSNRLEKAVEVL